MTQAAHAILAYTVCTLNAHARAESARYLIEPLHRAGYGPARIAMVLNGRRVPCPGQLSGHGGQRWRRWTVVRALKRLGLER